MASRYNRADIVQAPIQDLAVAMLRFDRNTLAGFVEVAVAILDCADGDPETEPNGDETDHNHSEECFIKHMTGRETFPGCPISDPDVEHNGAEHDCEAA